MDKKRRFERFLERATEAHGDKFDYSLCEYSTAKIKVKIICPQHGEFFQTPDKHLAKHSKGCPKCWDDLRPTISRNNIKKAKKYKRFKPSRLPLTEEQVLKRFRDKFGDKYSYEFGDFKGLSLSKIQITCPVHGVHENIAQAHLISGTGCPKCGAEKSTCSNTQNYDFIVDQLTEKYSSFYEYPDSNRLNYKNKRSKIEIVCPKHGPFTKSAQKHLGGQACWPCKVEELIRKNLLIGGYSEQLFKERPELSNLAASIYFIKIGEFYKVGITRIKVENRISAIKSKAKIKNSKILFTQEGALKDCFLLEQAILNEFTKYRIYEPWSSELFSKNVLGKKGFEGFKKKHQLL